MESMAQQVIPRVFFFRLFWSTVKLNNLKKEMSNFSFAENCCLNFSKFPHCPGSLNKETTFAYYT